MTLKCKANIILSQRCLVKSSAKFRKVIKIPLIFLATWIKTDSSNGKDIGLLKLSAQDATAPAHG